VYNHMKMYIVTPDLSPSLQKITYDEVSKHEAAAATSQYFACKMYILPQMLQSPNTCNTIESSKNKIDCILFGFVMCTPDCIFIFSAMAATSSAVTSSCSCMFEQRRSVTVFLAF
jgi:hypothetical protein